MCSIFNTQVSYRGLKYGRFAAKFPAPFDKLAEIRRAIGSGEGFSSSKHVPLYFDLSSATIYNWMNQGVIPKAYKIGGRRRFKNSELLQAEALYEQV